MSATCFNEHSSATEEPSSTCRESSLEGSDVLVEDSLQERVGNNGRVVEAELE